MEAEFNVGDLVKLKEHSEVFAALPAICLLSAIAGR